MKGDWRERLHTAMVTGERLEKMAHELGIAELPFAIEPYSRHLDWMEWEKPLSDFRDRVLIIAKALARPPDVTEKRADDETVILKARWVIENDDENDFGNDKICVEGWASTDCRVIVDGQELRKTLTTRLHPECVEVVDRLEDLDTDDWKDAPREYAEAVV